MSKVPQWIVMLLRIALAGLFLWAGLAKLRDPQAFAAAITALRFFPISIVNLLALITPAVEIAAGLLILMPRWQRQGTLLCALLSVAFAILFARANYHGWEIHCGCFGQDSILAGTTFSGLLRASAMSLVGIGLYGVSLSDRARRGYISEKQGTFR